MYTTTNKERKDDNTMIDPKTRLQCVLKWPHDNMEKYSHIDCSRMMQDYDSITKCFIMPDQTAIFYVLTEKEAREKVVANLRPRLYSIDPDFIKDHSSLLSLENKKELLYRLIEEEQSDWIYDMIDDFELFIDDIIECEGFNPYISTNVNKSYRFDNVEINQKNQPVEHASIYVFKEDLKKSNTNNSVHTVNHTYVETKDLPILYVTNDDGKQYDVIITNTSEERALACEAIRDDLSMIEIDDIIAHSSVLSNLDKNNQEKTLEQIQKNPNGNTLLFYMLDDFYQLCNDLINRDGIETYVGNENTIRIETPVGLVLYLSPILN